MIHLLSRIHILQDKIHKVINDIRDIKNKAKLRKTKTHMYTANPNIYHNSGRTLRSGENHHPRLDWLDSEEAPGDSSPAPSTSAGCSTSTADTSALTSSPSETGGRYAQSDPPPEMITDCPVEEERGEIKEELLSPEVQDSRGGTRSEEEELPDLTPPTKASPDCPLDGEEDLHPNLTDLQLKRKGRKVVVAARKAVSDGPT